HGESAAGSSEPRRSRIHRAVAARATCRLARTASRQMSTTPGFGRNEADWKTVRSADPRRLDSGARTAGSPMMLIISIVALIGALRFRKQDRVAGIGQVTEKGAAA